MAVFDPDTFMQQTIDQPMETEFKLCPEGEYTAMIDDFTRDAFRTNDFTYSKGPNAGQPGSMTTFECPWVINDTRLEAAIGRDRVVVRQSCILDFGADGGLDFGINKNLSLGRIRDAVDQNRPGPWQITQLRGAGPAMVRVVHKEIKPKDKPAYKVAEVDRCVAIK